MTFRKPWRQLFQSSKIDTEGADQAPIREASRCKAALKPEGAAGPVDQNPSSSRLNFAWFKGELLPRPSAEKHGLLLVDWFRQDHSRGSLVLTAREVQAAYVEMCADIGVEPRPWNPVAHALAEMLRLPGRPLKTYEFRIDEQGVRRRLRVYIFPGVTNVVNVDGRLRVVRKS